MRATTKRTMSAIQSESVRSTQVAAAGAAQRGGDHGAVFGRGRGEFAAQQRVDAFTSR